MTLVYCTWQGVTPTSKAMYAEGDTEEPCYSMSRCSTHTDWWRVRQRWWKEGHRKRSSSELRRVVSRKQAQTEFVRKWGKSTFCLCQTPRLDKFSCIRQWTGVIFLAQYPQGCEHPAQTTKCTSGIALVLATGSPPGPLWLWPSDIQTCLWNPLVPLASVLHAEPHPPRFSLLLSCSLSLLSLSISLLSSYQLYSTHPMGSSKIVPLHGCITTLSRSFTHLHHRVLLFFLSAPKW